jgi:hypothetical protein
MREAFRGFIPLGMGLTNPDLAEAKTTRAFAAPSSVSVDSYDLAGADGGQHIVHARSCFPMSRSADSFQVFAGNRAISVFNSRQLRSHLSHDRCCKRLTTWIINRNADRVGYRTRLRSLVNLRLTTAGFGVACCSCSDIPSTAQGRP